MFINVRVYRRGNYFSKLCFFGFFVFFFTFDVNFPTRRCVLHSVFFVSHMGLRPQAVLHVSTCFQPALCWQSVQYIMRYIKVVRKVLNMLHCLGVNWCTGLSHTLAPTLGFISPVKNVPLSPENRIFCQLKGQLLDSPCLTIEHITLCWII